MSLLEWSTFSATSQVGKQVSLSIKHASLLLKEETMQTKSFIAPDTDDMDRLNNSKFSFQSINPWACKIKLITAVIYRFS